MKKSIKKSVAILMAVIVIGGCMYSDFRVYAEENSDEGIVPETTPNESECIVYWDYNQKDFLKNQTVEVAYGSEVTFPTPADVNGYRFLYWMNSDGAPVTSTSFKMEEKYVTFCARWQRVLGKGEHYLVINTDYGFEESVTLSGDPNTYEKGMTFYVPVDGTYIFE